MIIKLLTIVSLSILSKQIQVEEIITQLPSGYQKKKNFIYDPSNYLSKETLTKIQKHMRNIEQIGQFGHTKNIFVVIDKYEMPNAWIQNVQKFSENLFQKIVPKISDRYDSLFILYSIKDRQYKIRTGGQFNKYYIDKYADYNANYIKQFLKKDQYDQAFEALYKNIDFCLHGKQNHCYDYKYKFIMRFLFILFSLFLLYQIIKKFYYWCYKKDKLDPKVYKKFKTLRELKKNKVDMQLFIQENCCVCLEKLDNDEIQDKKNKEVFLECGHNFHQPCIEGWLKKRNDCPICRKKVKQCENRQENIIFNFQNEAEVIQAILDIHEVLWSTANNSSQTCNCLCNEASVKCLELLCDNGKCIGELCEAFCSGGSSGSW